MSGDPNSIAIMVAIDCLAPEFRKLVHEYGAVPVSRMIGEGYDDPDELRDALETWRQRRQDKLLADASRL
jgi:hypothetical protein